MTADRAKEILEESQCVITGSHIVYTKDDHGHDYADKERINRYPVLINELGIIIAHRFRDAEIDVVVAPAMGALSLMDAVARELSQLRGFPIPTDYTIRDETVKVRAIEDYSFASIRVAPQNGHNVVPVRFNRGDELVLKSARRVFKRKGQDVAGKRALVVEDILNTGGSAKDTVQSVLEVGGTVAGVSAIANRGSVTAVELGVEVLYALVELTMRRYSPEECPLCQQGVPVNTSVGHGRQFLEAKGAAAR